MAKAVWAPSGAHTTPNYEMLTGRRAFPGDDVAETLAAVFKTEPDWNALPEELPPAARRLLRRCLAKDRKSRFAETSAIRLDIDEALTAAAPHPSAAESRGARRPAFGVVAIASAAVLMAAATATVYYFAGRPAAATDVVSFEVQPAGITLSRQPVQAIALSPDGRHLAFTVATTQAREAVAVYTFETMKLRVVEGSEGMTGPNFGRPFWSPESRFVGFFVDGWLKKADVTGGPAQSICPVASITNGGTWNRDGTILFAGAAEGSRGLHRVPASGGKPTAVTSLMEGERLHSWPWFLPDHRHFLYLTTATAEDSGNPQRRIFVSSIDAPERRTEVATSSSKAIYADGHVLFVRGTTLLARPFDPRTLTASGEPYPVAGADNLNISVGGANAAFSASENGRLVYRRGATRQSSQLGWFSRTGTRLGTIGEPADQMNVQLSPDERSIAVDVLDPVRNSRDVEVYDLTRNGVRTRLTSNPDDDLRPVWSPDSRRVAFASARQGNRFMIFQKALNGGGAEELLAEQAFSVFPNSWSDDGLIFNSAIAAPTGTDIWRLPVAGARQPVPVVQTRFNEGAARVSPDGRWIAYLGNVGSGGEVFVRPADAAASSALSGIQVSSGGGGQPRWSRDGEELFYVAPDDWIMAVEVASAGATFKVGHAQPLFRLGGRTATWRDFGPGFNYDVSKDGRFLVNRAIDDTDPRPIIVVLNWTGALRK